MSNIHLLDAARQAADAFCSDVADVSLLTQSENAVFRVDPRRGPPFVIRVHRPGYNSAEEMASELVWVEALAEAGVPVHRPMRTFDGRPFVTVRVDGKPFRAGAVEWLAGEVMGDLLAANPADAPVRYHQLGGLLAALRVHSAEWTPPDGFRRRSWGTAGFLGDGAAWGRFWEVPGEPEHRSVLADVRQALRDDMSGWPMDRSTYGLIHADAHPENVMVSGSDLVLFDFDDCGYGWYMYDIAVALRPVMDEPWYLSASQALFAGYQEIHPLTDEDLARLPALLTMRAVISLSWLAARPELGHDELPARVDRAVEAARTYLAERTG